MNQQLQNQYFQQMPPLQPSYAQADEETPKEERSTSFFWIVFWVFVLVGLALSAFYIFFLEPIISKMRASILALQKRQTEVTEEYKEGARDALAYMQLWKPEKTELQPPQEEVPNEEILHDEAEALLMMPPPKSLDEEFTSINEKYGLVEKSLMTDTNRA